MSKNVKLIEACMAGNLEAVHKLLAQGAKPNSLPKSKPYFGAHSPLTAAVQGGNLSVVQRLVAAGADIQRETDSSMTPLFVAVREHNLEIVQYLLSLGANPNVYDHLGNDTPLHSAVFYPDILRSLINAGANFEVQVNYDLSTPLLFAAEHYQYESVKILLDAGANINHVDRMGHTALSRAVRLMPRSNETVKLLLSRGADTTIRDYYGKTAKDNARQPEEFEKFVSEAIATRAWEKRKHLFFARHLATNPAQAANEAAWFARIIAGEGAGAGAAAGGAGAAAGGAGAGGAAGGAGAGSSNNAQNAEAEAAIKAFRNSTRRSRKQSSRRRRATRRRMW